VLLCVEQSLVSNEVFNAPYPRSKMDMVKGMIAKYIVSTAKPDWLYMIRRQEYDSFTPSANADISQLVPGGFAGQSRCFQPSLPVRLRRV
jgi:hypothetical protein